MSKKIGDYTKKDETIAQLYFNDLDKERINEAINEINKAFEISDNIPNTVELIAK